MILAALFLSAAVQQVTPETMQLAQTHDRCMTTFAVRLSKETTDDEAIFEQAQAGCAELEQALDARLDADLGPDHAPALKAQLEVAAKPNFLAMLDRIRRDRAAREPSFEGEAQ
ncbi:hypothetical protein [Sphingomicrobium arenosum]|uniref:hypothetical protein n=1 Tax=Sphingomicrobium arenosum TaxID=2233861 RepID=UPI002240F84F|nr:hypothetical protein [Sphingomicrobium arenosum]